MAEGMQDRVGVIDLGSNTFHLLIVDVVGDQFSIVYKERNFVGLAEKGIAELSTGAMTRGLMALAEFKSKLELYETKDFKVIGTSALRSAKNSQVFIDRAREDVGFDIEIIDGCREAELIYKGVNQLLEASSDNQMIMDIGGGSVEFILVRSGKLLWSESFDIGIGVLYNLVSLSDPISAENMDKIESFLDSKLDKLNIILKDKGVDALVGASGSFEVIQSMNGRSVSSNLITEVSLAEYHDTSDLIVKSTIAEREKMNGLPASRVKLIVVATLLINKAIELIKPGRLLISPYALKEGVISEL